jgi:hypothetical protein
MNVTGPGPQQTPVGSEYGEKARGKEKVGERTEWKRERKHSLWSWSNWRIHTAVVTYGFLQQHTAQAPVSRYRTQVQSVGTHTQWVAASNHPAPLCYFLSCFLLERASAITNLVGQRQTRRSCNVCMSLENNFQCFPFEEAPTLSEHPPHVRAGEVAPSQRAVTSTAQR